MERFVIEEAREQDLDAVLAIEGQSFPTPWPREAFEKELSLPFGGLLVARESGGPDGRLLGYVNYWVVDTEVHILTLAVDPVHRGQGLGRSLLARAEELGVDRGGRYCFLEVRRSNHRALDLYRGTGYTQVGVRRRYYSDNDEDAVVMVKVLVPDDAEVVG